MQHLDSFADERLLAGCIHCSGVTATRDHIPSRVLLDEPYPENLPVLPACARCNESFSLDEEYFACLVECSRTGSVDAVERPKIRRILKDSPALAARIMQARTVAEDGGISFNAESGRVRNVVFKLARGHAAYELNEQHLEEPSHVIFVPLHSLGPDAHIPHTTSHISFSHSDPVRPENCREPNQHTSGAQFRHRKPEIIGGAQQRSLIERIRSS